MADTDSPPLWRRLLVDAAVREQSSLLVSQQQQRDDADQAFFDRQAGRVRVAGEAVDLDPSLFRDLGVFEALDPSEKTLTSALERFARLRGSRLFTRALLKSPVRDPTTLEARARALRSIDPATREAVDQSLEVMAERESDVLWLYRDQEDEVRNLYDVVLFRSWFLKRLNGSGAVLTAYNLKRIVLSPAIGILSPVLYFIVPYLLIRFKLGLKIPVKTYVWLLYKSFTAMDVSALTGGGGNGAAWIKYASMILSMVFYFQSLFNSVEIAKTLYSVSKIVATRMKRTQRFLHHAAKLVRTVGPAFCDCFFQLDPLPANALDFTDSPDEGFSLFSNFGKNFVERESFDRQGILALLERAYAIDCIAGVCKCKEVLGFAWPRYVEPNIQEDSTLSLRGMWHPAMPRAASVPNMVVLGENHRNMLITGPNAGGKSTVLKAIAANVLLAQSLGICASEQAALTPVACLRTQINVPDARGQRSLFEAEMHRCKSSLDAARAAAAQGQHALVVIDEMFSSTNPVEGIAGAFAVARKLGEVPRCTSIISTHYIYLTKLSKETKASFKNYRVSVSIDPYTKEMTYPYTLTPGVSRQHVALQLLKLKGFDDDILDQAETIKAKLTAHSSEVHVETSKNVSP